MLMGMHPQCSPKLWTTGGASGKSLKLMEVGAYIPHDDPPPYDASSCFMMKARYNCAVRSNTSTANWKLVLRSKDGGGGAAAAGGGISTANCDLKSFVTDAGGPKGVAKHLLAQQERPNGGETTQTRYNVVLTGNSYLRQMTESMTCAWSDQITQLAVYQGGPSVSSSYLSKRGIKGDVDSDNLFEPHEMGSLSMYHRRLDNKTISNSSETTETLGSLDHIMHQGCRGVANNDKLMHFFHKDMNPKPSTIPDCNDNLFMVEFGSSIRFYYIYRPYMYSNLTHVYSMLGLHPGDIDRFVFNVGADKVIVKQREVYDSLRPGVYESGLQWRDMTAWRRLQELHVGRWSGCDNPGMDHVPDIHPVGAGVGFEMLSDSLTIKCRNPQLPQCMPGVPDDEVNLLLYLLYHHNISLDSSV